MFVLLIALLGSTLLSGVLVSAITNMLDRRGEDFDSGVCRYSARVFGLQLLPVGWYFGRYAVVLGGHSTVVSICRRLLTACDYVFVLTSSDIPAMRRNLRSALGQDERRVVLYYGNRADAGEMHDLYLRGAEEVYVIGEEDDAGEHDALNMKCLQNVAATLKSEGAIGIKRCYMQMLRQSTFTVLQGAGTPGVIDDVIEFIPYNFYESWAHKVLVTDTAHYTPIDGTGIGVDSAQTVHLVIVGMSRMGMALAIEAAHIAHYPNYVLDHRRRTRITFIDSEACTHSRSFMTRFPHLFALSHYRVATAANLDSWQWHHPEGADDFLDIEWEFIEGDTTDANVQRYLETGAMACNSLLTVAVCLPQDGDAVAAALYLPEPVLLHSQQVLVYQSIHSAVIDEIAQSPRYCRLRAFGMADMLEPSGLKSQRLAHVASRIYQSVWDDDFPHDAPLDFMRRYMADIEGRRAEWTTLPIWSQWSNRYNVSAIPTKARSAEASTRLCHSVADMFAPLEGYITGQPGHLMAADTGKWLSVELTGVNLDAEPQTDHDRAMHLLRLMSEVEHNRWDMEKLLMGYRPINTQERKLPFNQIKKLKDSACHAQYCICPFDELKQWDASQGVDTIGYDVMFTLMLPALHTYSNEEVNL